MSGRQPPAEDTPRLRAWRLTQVQTGHAHTAAQALLHSLSRVFDQVAWVVNVHIVRLAVGQQQHPALHAPARAMAFGQACGGMPQHGAQTRGAGAAQRLAARATEGRPSGSRAAATAAPGQVPRRIGPEREAQVFDIDMQRCPNCGARELKIIAAILERPVIEKNLTPLG